LCDVSDDKISRIAAEVGSRAKAFKLFTNDRSLVWVCLRLQPTVPNELVRAEFRKRSDKIGEQLTSYLRVITDENPLLKGIIDRVDINCHEACGTGY
jgi:type I restriction enzyme M protein